MFNKFKNFLRVDSNKKRVDKMIVNVKKKSKPTYKLDGWMNILTGLGQQGRDKTVATVFRNCRVFCVTELDELYRADGLTRRIIDLIPAEMMRQGWEIDGDPEGNLNGKLEELNAYTKITQLIQWSRLYGGAIIVMGVLDGRPLDEPVNLENIYDVAWLQVFDRWQAQVMQPFVCSDLNDANYGCPDFYLVSDYRTGATFQVHHSRVLRMDWAILPPRDWNLNQGWGDTALMSIYEELRNYGAAFANTSAIMQNFVNGILKMPGLSNSLASDCKDTDSKVLKRLDMANLSMGVTNMMVLDGEETYEKISTNVSGVADIIDRFMLSISSVTGIPLTLLFGRSPAGLNATGDADIRNFYDMIKQNQETKLRPVLEKLISYLFLSKDGSFKGVEPENWGIQFTPLWQNTEEQEANIKRTTAETDRIYIDTGVLDPNEVAISRFGGDRYSTNTLIDVKLRENGYDPEETQELERMKEQEIEKEPPNPTVGSSENGSGSNPDYLVV